MSCLQQLCSLLPFNPWHWNSLGQMCLQLLKKQTTSTLLTPACWAFAAFVSSDLLYLPSVDLCSSQSRETAEGNEAVDEEENAADFSEDRIWLKACISFIRTRCLRDSDCRSIFIKPLFVLFLITTIFLLTFPIRLLLRILQQQQSSFVLQRSTNTLTCTDEALQRLHPKESTLQVLTEVRTRCWVCVLVGAHLHSLSVSAT